MQHVRVRSYEVYNAIACACVLCVVIVVVGLSQCSEVVLLVYAHSAVGHFESKCETTPTVWVVSVSRQGEQSEKSLSTYEKICALYKVPDWMQVDGRKKTEEMLSNQMLLGIPEVDLGLELGQTNHTRRQWWG